MSDNRKYYYLRLKDNFFDSDELKLIEGMNDGYLYSNILLKLYLKSLKYDGKLTMNERIPYSPEMLASITGHNVGVVKQALVLFKDFGLIDILDNGAIYMLDIQNYIGRSSTEAERKKLYREKIRIDKELVEKLPMGQMSDVRPPEIEIEKEIEKEIELEKSKEKRKKKANAFIPPTLQELEAYIREKNLNLDAQHFLDYFNEGDWVDSNGKKVRSWKQKAIVWSNHGNSTRSYQKNTRKEVDWANEPDHL